MRYAAPAAALSLALALTASIGQSQQAAADPRAAALLAEGRAAMAAGNTTRATDAFEAALTVEPGYLPILLELGESARRAGLQGKAIGYYRRALAREPANTAALAGEGIAFAEKGAADRAKANLAKLQSLCGARCPETRRLAEAIARGPRAVAQTAQANTLTPPTAGQPPAVTPAPNRPQ